MKALRIDRKLARFAAARVAGSLRPGSGAAVGPLELADIDPPELPAAGWVQLRPRLAGICGSDLSTVDGAASRYFEPIVSFPFVPGHEVVADTDDDRRVVLEPVLGCVARGISPLCVACARGDLGGCERLAFGRVEPGLQTGFCCSTGGGWGTFMVAHESQLHPVPEAMTDEAAVLVEPTACAVHAALTAGVTDGDIVVVLGAGTLGLLTIAALRRWTGAGQLVAVAKHPQQRAFAADLGADVVCEPGELGRLVRRLTGSLAYGNQLTGGADIVVDCVGSDESIQQSLAVVRPRGRVVLVGMPATVKLDLTTLWHRETSLVGAYAYGTEDVPERWATSPRPGAPNSPNAEIGMGLVRRRTFDLAFELVQEARLERLLSATYPLADYRLAIEHAAAAGRRGAVKVAFELRTEKERYR
jgi:threonine dehydrogenase-like Zn-dependent dehydrogenase